jgi:rfaE bifunctional protein nucleotidyltransferase chain/domain
MEHFEIIRKKIVSLDELLHLAAGWRFKELKIVFTNGCFDLLHRGHIEYLSKARDFGDLLVVGLNTDESVRKIKGAGRPVQDQESRALVLASLSVVTWVILFNEETPLDLISKLKPHVLVKGGDYKSSAIVGADVVHSYGGSVKVIPFIEGYSSSSLIRKISG